jgi:hypothetical protein
MAPSSPNSNYNSSESVRTGNSSVPDMQWETLIGKEAKTLDNSELGKVKQVATEYVFTEKGVIDKEKFFIPRRFADRFDGKTLWLSITKAQAENEFRREIPPGPGEYAKRYTTVEKKITERTIETGPSGETRERVDERTA